MSAFLTSALSHLGTLHSLVWSSPPSLPAGDSLFFTVLVTKPFPSLCKKVTGTLVAESLLRSQARLVGRLTNRWSCSTRFLRRGPVASQVSREATTLWVQSAHDSPHVPSTDGDGERRNVNIRRVYLSMKLGTNYPSDSGQWFPFRVVTII